MSAPRTRLGSKPWLTWAVAAACSGCHVFTDLEDCDEDADCAFGSRCNPEGDFCELDRGPVRVGVLLPQNTDLLLEREEGLETAKTWIESRGGIDGRTIEYLVRNDRPVEEAVASTEDLIESRVVAVIAAGSSSVLETQALTGPERILTISPVATTPALTDAQPAGDRYVFRTVPPAQLGEAAAMALYIREGDAPLCDTLVTMSPIENAFGQGYRQAIADLFEGLGGCLAADIDLPKEPQLSYDEVLDALRSISPDCALLIDTTDAGGPAVIRQFHDEVDTFSRPIQWLGGSSFTIPLFLERTRLDPPNATPSAAEGMILSAEYTTLERQQTQQFAEIFEDVVGRAPDPTLLGDTTSYFDAVMLIALSLERAGGATDRVAIRDGFVQVSGVGSDHAAYGPVDYATAVAHLESGREIHYVGASGNLVFTDGGDPSRDHVIRTIAEGEYVDVRVVTAEDALDLAEREPTPADCPPTMQLDLSN